jgi:hypothetical protein
MTYPKKTTKVQLNDISAFFQGVFFMGKLAGGPIALV